MVIIIICLCHLVFKVVMISTTAAIAKGETGVLKAEMIMFNIFFILFEKESCEIEEIWSNINQSITCCLVVKESCEIVCWVWWPTRARALRQWTDCPGHDNNVDGYDNYIDGDDNHDHQDDNNHDNCDDNDHRKLQRYWECWRYYPGELSSALGGGKNLKITMVVEIMMEANVVMR